MHEDGMRKIDGFGDGLGLIEPLLDKLLGFNQDARLSDGISCRCKFLECEEVLWELRVSRGLVMIPDGDIGLFLPPPIAADILAKDFFIRDKIQEIVSDLIGHADVFPYLL